MKEAFCAKQLSLCKTTRDLQQWGCLNCRLGVGSVSYQSQLKDVPRVLHQTNKQDHEKLKEINTAFLPDNFKREFHDDARCQAYIKSMLGSTALQHYHNLAMPAHRADFFRYVLLFYEGGVYLDIKSCFLKSLEKLLSSCGHCSLLSCIGAAGSHIHQGILMCPAGHPLLHEAILKVMETPASSLGPRSGAYMTFCQQMWDILKREVGEIVAGENTTCTWGCVFLMRERKEKKGSRDVLGQSIKIDGHVAYMEDGDAAVAIRCEGWNRGFNNLMPDMPQLEVFAQLSVSAVVNEQEMGVVEIEQGRNQREQGDAQPSNASEMTIERVLEEQQKYYAGLTPDEVRDWELEGLVATSDGWLGCSVHQKKGRCKKFATWFCLGLDLDLDHFFRVCLVCSRYSLCSS